MLLTALYLAPQPARAEEAAPFDLAKAIRDAKTPAEHEAIASYCDRAATAAHAKAAEYCKLALNSQHLAMTGRSQFLSDGHYRQLERYYKRLAAEHTASAETQRQMAQALAQKPQ
jgi:hypothetical protein